MKSQRDEADASKRKEERKMKNEMFLNLVCADIRNKKIYVTSGTMKRSILYTVASDLIREYESRYPGFEVEVNDRFFLKKFGVIPA